MKKKRLLSLLLVLVMLVGLFPTSVLAAEGDTAEPTETVEITPEPTAVPTPEPTAVPTPEPTQAPTPEPVVEAAPAEEPAAPAEEPAAPAEEPAAPAEEPAAPAEEPEAPAEEPAAPAEEPEAPAEEPAAPAEEPAAPAEEPEAPAEEPAAPAEEQEAPAAVTNKAAGADGEEEPTVTKIEVTTQPKQNVYLVGGTLITDGLVVTATLSDGNKRVLADSEFTLSGFDSSTVGEKTITVTYGSGDDTLTATFKKIYVKQDQPAEIVYTGEKFNFTDEEGGRFGMFEPQDGTTATLAGDTVYVTFYPNQGKTYKGFYIDTKTTDAEPSQSRFIGGEANESTPYGVYHFTLDADKYCGKGVAVKPVKADENTTQSQYYMVVPAKDKIPTATVTAIAVTTLPNKTEYNIGEKLDPTGIVVTATMNVGDPKALSAQEYDLSELDSSTAGKKTITVTYGTGEDALTATFEVNVNAVDPAPDADVYVTISNAGVLALARSKVTVKDLNSDGRLTYDEAMVATHTEYYSGGASGFATNASGWVTRLWGVDTNNSSYFQNGETFSELVNNQPVNGGDELVAGVLKDNDTYSDYFAWITPASVEAEVGKGVELTVNIKPVYFAYEEMTAEGLQLGTWEAGTFTAIAGAKTDAQGKATVTFTEPGSYIVSAAGLLEGEKDDYPIMAPCCFVTVKGEAPSRTDLTITNNTNMFKAVTAYLESDGENTVLVMALSSTGYRHLFKGTYEQAAANGDNRENWITAYENEDGKLEFRIPLEADETYVPVVAISKSYLDKYEQGQNPLERAFYPRQLTIDAEAKTLVTGDYEYTQDLDVTNNVKMFKVSGAKLYTIGGPNSNGYKSSLLLTMDSTSFDKAFVGTSAEAEAASETIALGDDNVFDIPVKWVETFGQPDTLQSLIGEPFVMSFHSVSKDAWYNRIFTISENDGTLVIDEAVGLNLDTEDFTLVCGKTRKITAKDDAGAELTDVVWSVETEWAARDDEDVVTVDNGTVKAVSVGAAKVTATHNGETASVTVTTLFSDVTDPDNQYYFAPVYWAAQNGVTTGTSATEFSPNNPCTRGQIVTFLYRAYGSPEPTLTENPFTDVKDTDYFYKAVLWAVENDVTTGTSATTFSPKDPCTRKQIVTFLWRAEGSPEPTSDTNPFKDVKPSDYFYKAVLWAVEKEVTTGTSPTTFAPNNKCTRGQCVTFLMRAVAGA